MKTSKIFLVLGVSVLLFTACKKEDPTAKIFLKKIVIEATAGGMTQTIASEYTWKNDLLVSEQNTISVLGIPIISTKHYEYEGNNVVHTYKVLSNGDTTLHWYFTYENGRLKTYTNETTHGVITGYNSNGEITGFEDISSSRINKYEFEWKDGDLVKATINTTYANGTSTDSVYSYTYDNKPSAYSNMPIVLALNDAGTMAMHASKHNLLNDSSKIEYKNDRLVKRILLEDKVSYYYTDGVGPDSE